MDNFPRILSEVPCARPLVKPLQGQRVLVTGAAGFIGKLLTRRLSDKGAHPIAWTHQTVDLRQTKATRRHMEAAQPDAVIHLATSMRGRQDAFVSRPVDLLMTINVLEAIAAVKTVGVFLHVGTLDEYGRGPTPFCETQAMSPLTSYAAAKAASGLFWTMAGGIHVRLPLVYGPGQDLRFFVPQLLRSLVLNIPLAMSYGEQIRDFIFIEDVVEGLIRILNAACAGESVNLCTGVGTALKDVVTLAHSVSRLSGNVQMGALPYRAREIFDCVGSTAKLQGLLEWSPAVSLEEGLRQTLQALTSSCDNERKN